jgi:hypothetical protein
VGKPLLTLIRDLATDPAEQAAFQAAPQDYLGRHGYDGVTADELREAVSLAADTMEPQVAQAITPPEGDEANIIETLQRVTHGTGAAFTDTAVTGTVPAPDETAMDIADVDTGGPDLAFGAGSAGEVDFDSGFGKGDAGGDGDMVDTLSFGEAPPTADPDRDLDDLGFDDGAPSATEPVDVLEDDQSGLDDDFQSAEEFTADGEGTGMDLLDEPLDDIGAF